MPEYTTTCQKCGRPFTEVRVCCDRGLDSHGGYVEGRCVDCCHGQEEVRKMDERVQRQRLSSAAPDLLSALEAVEDVALRDWRCYTKTEMKRAMEQIVAKAHTAIAHAKGDTK